MGVEFSFNVSFRIVYNYEHSLLKELKHVWPNWLCLLQANMLLYFKFLYPLPWPSLSYFFGTIIFISNF